MDRRSWLWRRKSSEKSPNGETESSGSVSSHSERFSDDQILSNQNTQSHEITSKAAFDDELNIGDKTLSEKLSEALLDVRSKEDLVKQHAKVAEEAVSGWERVENEMLVLKKQLETSTQKNLILEERVGHLDGALKECLRQLRQAREEREEKIQDALVRRSCEWESTKTELESKLVDLRFQLQTATTDAIDARSKLEASEKENSILKLKFISKDKELALRKHEQDLSTHAAETASKQHLDGIKKIASLEAECRRLKAMARKAAAGNDYQSITASSMCVDSLTNCQSESGERMLFLESESIRAGGLDSADSEPFHPDSWASALAIETRQHKNETTLGRSNIVPIMEIDLMDDFLEMERLAALPDGENDPAIEVNGREDYVRDGSEIMIKRTSELKENLKKMEIEKLHLEIALNECQIQLKTSEHLLKQAEWKLDDLSSQFSRANEAKTAAEQESELLKLKLKNSTLLLEEAEVNQVKIQNQLTNVIGAKCNMELELEDANSQKIEAESKLKVLGIELEIMRSNIRNLEKDLKSERNLSQEAQARCEMLETEILRMKLDSQFQRSAIVEEFRINQDKELTVAASKFAECQKTIASLGRQLESLPCLDDFLIDTDRPISIL